MIDIDAVRADTPACRSLLHFNNAGASLMPALVCDALIGHIELERDIGGYEAEAQASESIAAFYDEFAGLLNCRPQEIAYVENATRAWDMAFYSLPMRAGDRVITHGSEYSSNFLAFLQQSKRRGIAVDVAPSDASGQVDVPALEALIREETRLIALTHVPTQGGLVNPVEAIGAVASRHEIPYLLDACQSVGQIDVDVRRIGCQMLSGTGRKWLRGPRGTGFLYVQSDFIERLDPPFIDMRAADWIAPREYRFASGAQRFENWESYVAGRIGLTAAVRYARALGLPAIESRVNSLAESLREALSAERGIEVLDLGERRCGIVTFTKADESPAGLAARLRRDRINVSVSDRQSAQIDFRERGIDSLVRASIHYFNTQTEIERFVRAVAS